MTTVNKHCPFSCESLRVSLGQQTLGPMALAKERENRSVSLHVRAFSRIAKRLYFREPVFLELRGVRSSSTSRTVLKTILNCF